jgi:hypothetical protein
MNGPHDRGRVGVIVNSGNGFESKGRNHARDSDHEVT